MTFLESVAALDKAEAEIFEYFGYEQDWRVFPLDFQLNMYWVHETHEITYAGNPEILTPWGKENLEGDYYTSQLYRGPESVWRGEDFTMVLLDTQCDGNIFLTVFSNDKECKLTDECPSNINGKVWCEVLNGHPGRHEAQEGKLSWE